jgi:hypothetical protein
MDTRCRRSPIEQCQPERMAETKILQDVIHLQMMWPANQTPAICRALSKANGFYAVGDAKAGEVVNS